MHCGRHTLHSKWLHLSKLEVVFITIGGSFDSSHTTLTYLTPGDNDRVLDVIRVEGPSDGSKFITSHPDPPIDKTFEDKAPKAHKGRDRRQNSHQPHTSQLLNGFLAMPGEIFSHDRCRSLCFPSPTGTGTTRNVVVSQHHDST
jgi:hypothetical protein